MHSEVKRRRAVTERVSRIFASEIVRAAAAALALPLLAGVGCVQTPRGVQGYESGTEQNDFFVPASFDLVDAQNYTAAVGLRSWTGVYRGKAVIGA